MNIRFTALLLLAGTTTLVACKTTAPEVLPPLPVQTTPRAATPPPAVAAIPAGPAIGSQEHFVNAVQGQNIIYFDTDRYNVDNADMPALQSQAQYLLQYTAVNITIEGHCDERGTREYNLALGERRANAAKNYLVSLGVSADRIRTVSYGKERPSATGSNAEAWAQNRRAASIVIG